MNIRKIILVMLLLAMTGCAITTSPTPIDYNPEDDVAIDVQTGQQTTAPENTEPYVKAADFKGVVVEVFRIGWFYDEQYKSEIQEWEVMVTNTNKRTKCVGVIWRLMDFQFITEYPTTMIVPGETKVLLGTMLGDTMEIDGVTVWPSPSGYVHEIQVLNPDWDADEGFECMFLPEEDKINTQ